MEPLAGLAALPAGGKRLSRLSASHRNVEIEGQDFPIVAAEYLDGDLELVRRWALGRIVLRGVPHETAVVIVDALGVPEAGVRAILARGPVGDVPLLGGALVVLGPLMALFGGAVLLFGSSLAPGASLAFSAIFATGAAVSVIAVAPRAIVVTAEGLELRWLGTRSRWKLDELAAVELVGWDVVVRPRSGRARRYRLEPALRPTTACDARGMESESMALATARASAPVHLAARMLAERQQRSTYRVSAPSRPPTA